MIIGKRYNSKSLPPTYYTTSLADTLIREILNIQKRRPSFLETFQQGNPTAYFKSYYVGESFAPLRLNVLMVEVLYLLFMIYELI